MMLLTVTDAGPKTAFSLDEVVDVHVCPSLAHGPITNWDQWSTSTNPTNGWRMHVRRGA